MARITNVVPTPSRPKTPSSPPLGATVVLARWRLHNTLGMLLITGLGMIAAVMLVCAVPLYSQISTTAGLHSVFSATPDSSVLRFHATLQSLSPSIVQEVRKRIEPIPQSTLATYLDKDTQFSLQSQGFPIISSMKKQNADTLALLGNEMNGTASHIKLLSGRLPSASSNELEAVVTSQTASKLNVHPGSIIPLKFQAYTTFKGDTGTGGNNSQIIIDTTLPLHLVGIYAPTVANDVFWHGSALDPVAQPHSTAFSYNALVSNEALVTATVNTIPAAQKNTASGNVFLSLVSDAYWYYHLNPKTLSITNVNALQNSLQTMQSRLADDYGTIQESPNFPYIQSADVSGAVLSTYQGPGTLERFSNRVNVARIPVTILMLEAVALILFFISMMAELLVERQSDAIAVLRSRGASRSQIFGAFFTQSLGLGLFALILGPLLAVVAVYLLIQRVLGSDGQGALNVTLSDTGNTLLLVGGYALIAVAIAILAMGLSTYRAVGFDVLALRRESARSGRRSLWQRFNLDLVAIVVAVAGYAISLYLNTVPGLDAQTRVLVQSPLALIAPTFLLLAGILILLRIFPQLLRLGATLATRGRGASAVLALGQMSRAPRQSVRMALLLALATAFAIFSLLFTASQAQHVLDVAAYQVGADFSGTIPNATTDEDIARDTNALKSIHGVTSVTLGYTQQVSTVGQNVVPVEIRAVDANTFAQTARWNDASVPLASLMKQFVAERVRAEGSNFVPAIVDALTWNRLGLSEGTRFTLQAAPSTDTSDGTITFIAMTKVGHIPTVNDSTEPGDSSGSPLPGGIIVDYRSYATVYKQMMLSDSNSMPADAEPLPVNHVWLRTSDDASSVANVRTALTKNDPQVNPLLDRRALVDSLNSDPLTLDLIGELALGASTALFLALLGNLLASWLSARNRLTNFAILRALGTSPAQVASVLTWEQGITYITALVLGVLFGTLLSFAAIPGLVFTSVPANGPTSGTNNGEFYALQHILPVRIVVPPALLIALAVLVIICLITLSMMIRVVTKPQLSQALRLNED